MSIKEIMSVGELKKELESLDDSLPVELMIHYDHSYHIQDLKEVHVYYGKYCKDGMLTLKGDAGDYLDE